MIECECPRPVESTNPRRAGVCVRCLGRVGPQISGQEAVRALLDRLEITFPSWPEMPSTWETFRALVEARSAQGQRLYGNRWKYLDNIAEGGEEASDGPCYAAFTAAQHGDDNIDLLLSAAKKFYGAYEDLAQYRAKMAGDPGKGWSAPEEEDQPAEERQVAA